MTTVFPRQTPRSPASAPVLEPVSFDSAPDFLTAADTARLLRLGRTFTYELLDRGDIPSIRFGRAIRVSKAALRTWVEEHAGVPNPNHDAPAGAGDAQTVRRAG